VHEVDLHVKSNKSEISSVQCQYVFLFNELYCK